MDQVPKKESVVESCRKKMMRSGSHPAECLCCPLQYAVLLRKRLKKLLKSRENTLNLSFSKGKLNFKGAFLLRLSN